MPHSPCWANLYFDGAIGNRFWPEVMVVSRWPMPDRVGQVLVVPLVHRRLVVIHVHLRRPADHVQIDHLLGLGGEMKRAGQWAAAGRCRRSSGLGRTCRAGGARPSRPRSAASAAQLTALEPRLKNCRRVS